VLPLLCVVMAAVVLLLLQLLSCSNAIAALRLLVVSDSCAVTIALGQ
jgi:hypothetical protein